MRLRHQASTLLIALFLASAARAGDAEKGLASWYGGKFHGRQTASGERFDKEAMTAAHRTLPFGTLIEVKNLDTGDMAVLRVNDRGPFVHGRILDCSEGAARILGFVDVGVVPVRIAPVGRIPDDGEKLTKKQRKRLRKALEEADRTRRDDNIPRDLLVPVDLEAGPFEVQVGAFRDPKNAERLAGALTDNGWTTRTMVTAEGFTRVRVGPFPTRAAAEEAVVTLDLDEDPFVVRAD
jgi:rare lipoprotein A